MLGSPAEIAAQYESDIPLASTKVSDVVSEPAQQTADFVSEPVQQTAAVDTAGREAVDTAAGTAEIKHTASTTATQAKRYVYAEDYTGKPRVSDTEPKPAEPARTEHARGYQPGGYEPQSNKPREQNQFHASGYIREDIQSSGYRPVSDTTSGTRSGEVRVESGSTSAINVILLVLLNLFIALPIVLVIISLLVGVWLFALGVGAAAVALIIAAVAEAGAGIMTIILILFAIALAALTILIFIGAYWLTVLFARGLGAYINWNQSVAKGGSAT